MNILSLQRIVLTTSLKYCDRVCVSVSNQGTHRNRLAIDLWKYRDGVNVNFAQYAIRDCLFSGCEVTYYGVHELIVDTHDEFKYDPEGAQQAVFTLAQEILSIYRTEGRDIKVNTNMCPDLIGIEVTK